MSHVSLDLPRRQTYVKKPIVQGEDLSTDFRGIYCVGSW
jgi:hypothetical protein